MRTLRTQIILAALLLALHSAKAEQTLSIKRLLVNKQEHALPGVRKQTSGGTLKNEYLPLTIPPAELSSFSIVLGKHPQEAEQGVRFRYKLEGYNADFGEMGGAMRLSARLVKKNLSDFVGIANWHVSGTSPGWSSNRTDIVLHEQTQSIHVVPDVEALDISVVSGGGVDAVGLLIIADISVYRVHNQVRDPEPWLIARFTPDKNKKPSSPWTPYMRPDLSEVVQLPQLNNAYALQFSDLSNTSYTEYNFNKSLPSHIKPGDDLLFVWKWAYSVGSDDIASPLVFNRLLPGRYLLRLQRVNADATQILEEILLPVVVPTLYYKTPWFIVLCSFVISVLLFGSIAWLYRRRMKARMAHLELLQKIELERIRIARDIHDDLGSRITQIRFVAETALMAEKLPPEHQETLHEIVEGTLDAGNHLHEIIWSVKTENDTLEALANYLLQTVDKLCSACNMRYRIDMPPELPKLPISSQVRYNIMMAIREAVTNALKHACASELFIHLHLAQDRTLTIRICDNGKGFDPSKEYDGEGIKNIQGRIRDIHGKVEWKRVQPSGTEVEFTLDLNNLNHT